MNTEKDYLKDITEIRSMMEKSSRFISLSGLSGIFAGIFAIIGAGFAFIYLKLDSYSNYYEGAFNSNSELNSALDRNIISNNNLNYGFIGFAIIDALCILILSLLIGYLLTSRKARKNGLNVWDKSAKQLLINLAIPLVGGALFCVALLYHGLIGLIAPATLIFYGLALINGSKFTLDDVKYLGICEITLGIISAFVLGYGLVFWVFGFGILHIVYGTIMYFKYEHNK